MSFQGKLKIVSIVFNPTQESKEAQRNGLKVKR